MPVFLKRAGLMKKYLQKLIFQLVIHIEVDIQRTRQFSSAVPRITVCADPYIAQLGYYNNLLSTMCFLYVRSVLTKTANQRQHFKEATWTSANDIRNWLTSKWPFKEYAPDRIERSKLFIKFRSRLLQTNKSVITKSRASISFFLNVQ